MKKLFFSTFVAIVALTSMAKATVSVGHVETAGTSGIFLSSTGATLSNGGVAIGYFVSAPLDNAFGTTITSWSTLLSAGFIDVRSMSGVDTTGLDWNFPGIAGTTSNIPFSATTTTSSAIAQNTQLYVFAFNSGTYNTVTPANSFVGSTEWAVVKDNANLSPSDLGTKTVILNTATGATEILKGADNGSADINLTSMVPEPSTVGLVGMGLAGLFAVRRSKRRLN